MLLWEGIHSHHPLCQHLPLWGCMAWWGRDLILFHIWRTLVSISAFQYFQEVKCNGKYQGNVTKAYLYFSLRFPCGKKLNILEMNQAVHSTGKQILSMQNEPWPSSHTVWQVVDAPNVLHMSRSPLECTQNPWETSAQPLCAGSVTVPSAFLGVQNSCRNCCPDQAVGHQHTLDKYPKSSFSAQAKFLDRDKGHVKTKQTEYTMAQVLMPHYSTNLTPSSRE